MLLLTLTLILTLMLTLTLTLTLSINFNTNPNTLLVRRSGPQVLSLHFTTGLLDLNHRLVGGSGRWHGRWVDRVGGVGGTFSDSLPAPTHSFWVIGIPALFSFGIQAFRHSATYPAFYP